jgi:triphosphatase
MADTKPTETEIRLLAPTADDLRAIARLTRLGPYPLRSHGVVRLHRTYLDTAGLTLARHGVALRLRRQGRLWEAGLERVGRTEDAARRPEPRVELAAAPASPFAPPEPLHTQIAALLAGRPLTPILLAEARRRRIEVLPPDPARAGDPIAELKLDRVRLRAPPGEQATDSYEVAVERRHGDLRDVTAVERALRHDFSLVRAGESELQRGLTAFYGGGIIGSADRRVLAHDTVRDGVRHIVGRHLYRLRLHDPGTRAGESPEALHDMRVATRRLRAAVRVFAEGIPVRSRDRLKRELRWLGQLLGPVRDLDVQLAKLDAFTAASPAGFRPALGRLREHMAGERRGRRAEMVAGLEAKRYFRLLLRLERFADAQARGRAGTAAQERIAVAGRRAIKKAFRRLIERGNEIGETPQPEDLHALRIRAKRLRYLLEFLGELTGKPGRRLIKYLVELQDLLGSYHDAVVWADFVRGYVEAEGARLEPAQVVALGALVAAELRVGEQKRGDFEDTWRRFARPRTTADCRALLRKLRRLRAAPAGETAGRGGAS